MKAILIAVLLMVSTVTNFAQASIELPTIICVIESTKVQNNQLVKSGAEIFEGNVGKYTYNKREKVASFLFEGVVKTQDLNYKIAVVVQREYSYFSSDVEDSLISTAVSAVGTNSQVAMSASAGPFARKKVAAIPNVSNGMINLELMNKQAVEAAFLKGNPNAPAIAWSFSTLVEDSLRKSLLPDNTVVSATVSCIL